MWYSLAGFLLLTAITAVFVMAEFSFTVLEKSTIETSLKEKNSLQLQKVKEIHETLSTNLSSIQLGITVTTLITGAIAYPVFQYPLEKLLNSISEINFTNSNTVKIIALVLATTISMVFGELIPKNIAIAYPLKIAKNTAIFITTFTSIFSVLVKILNKVSNYILKIMEIAPSEEISSARSPEELESIVQLAAKSGRLDQVTADIIDKSIAFGEYTAEELMTPRTKIIYLSADSSIKDLIELSEKTGKSRFPVVENNLDNCIGIVHIKQAFTFPTAKIETTKLSTIVNPLQSVPASLDGDSLMSRIRSGSMQLALVVDEYGSTAGIVTMEDLIEEIVGDVQDEHDKELDQLVAVKNGWICSGLLRIDEFYRLTNIAFPEGEYDTLGGLILDVLGKIPKIQDKVTLTGILTPPQDADFSENVSLKIVATVLGMDKRRIDLIELSPAEEDVNSNGLN